MAATGQTGGMAWRIRIPLWMLLPGLAVGVVALGAVAAGTAGIQQARGYLTRQSDSNLSACAASVLSQHFTAGPTAGPAPSGACDIELLSAGGLLLTPPAPGQSPAPAIPAEPPWLAAHTARPVTVSSAGAAGSWEVLLEPVHYQPQRILFVYGPEDDVKYVISGRGSAGLLVVMTRTAGLGRLPAQVATAAGAVLVLLGVAGLALTRAVLRPLRDASRFASVPAAISQQMDASRTAAAAARRSVGEMADRLSKVSLELRTSIGVVRGFAEYCRQPGKPPPAAGHPMTRRAADEITRMETLVARLDAPPDPAVTAFRPGRR
jgi:hypothetical protein